MSRATSLPAHCPADVLLDGWSRDSLIEAAALELHFAAALDGFAGRMFIGFLCLPCCLCSYFFARIIALGYDAYEAPSYAALVKRLWDCWVAFI